MLLVFGGTTEGRKVAKVCDRAGTSFFYATKGNLQKVAMSNGQVITGGMNADEIINFIRSNAIRLIINAAHPFAKGLHQNIVIASETLGIPVIRYERIFHKRYKEALWFDIYQDAVNYLLKNKYQNILVLTGVNTIAKLKELWTQCSCTFRILDRADSKEIARKEGFPQSQLLYYQKGTDELTLFKSLNPEAIITKESGESGGFYEKWKAAKQLGIPFLVIKRPKLSEHFVTVYGEHGLRKEIERLADGFFKLKTGFTTGTCATAATKSALMALLTKEKETKVSITLPNGEWVFIPISEIEILKDKAIATVLKDSGDDPDITNGTRILSTVSLTSHHKGIHFLQGEGVGRITLPGVGLPIGAPAINKTPRKMIKQEIFKVLRHHQDKLPNRKLSIGIDVTISVPDGKELAKHTFNPKIGIVDGISIIGTSGVVKPFSSEAFVAAIHREMQVAKALGVRHIILNSGAKSENYIRARYPQLPPQAFIHYGNFIGETLMVADKLGLEKLTIGIMIGKAVKLAEGNLDTHSKKAVMNKDFIREIAEKAGCPNSVQEQIKTMNMARELWKFIPEKDSLFYQILLTKCKTICQTKFKTAELEVLLIDNWGNSIDLNK